MIALGSDRLRVPAGAGAGAPRACIYGPAAGLGSRRPYWCRGGDFPGSSRLGAPGVGGEYAGALVVRVGARAVGGGATAAALSPVAVAFGVPRDAVTLVAGASSRTKIVDVRGADAVALTRLLAGPGGIG